MNRTSSSSNLETKKFFQSHRQPQLPSKKKERIPRNPLKDVNSRSSGAGGRSSNGGVSGSVSGQDPYGRVRLLLSHSGSLSSSSSSSSLGASLGHGPVRSVSKTPKPAPGVTKPLPRNKGRVLGEIKQKDGVSEKLTSQQPLKCKRTNVMSRLGHCGKRPTGKSTLNSNKTSALDEFPSDSRELKQKESGTTVRIQVDSTYVTPVCKPGIGSGQGYGHAAKITADGRPSIGRSPNDRTPPVQESVSPELQCGSSMMLSAATKSQVCYATGHILSGISDKRKCRPKGILIVGENGLNVSKPKPLNNFDDADFAGRDSTVLTMPLPADASMQWLSSPCDEEKTHEKETFGDDLYQFQWAVGCEGLDTPSPLSDHSISSDVCNISSGISLSPEHSGKGMRRSTGSLVSPNEHSRLRSFMYPSSDKDMSSAYDTTPTCEVDLSLHSEEVRNHRYCIGDKRSPSSFDTMGRENVMKTPESNSSSAKYHRLSWFQTGRHKSHDLDSDFDSLTVALNSASLSPKSHASSLDPNSSSFHFESLATSSDSVDLSLFQRVLVNRSSCLSNSTLGVTMSWREEISSQIPEIAELDSCRDLSDEEESMNGSSVKQLPKTGWIQNNGTDAGNDKRGARLSGQFVSKGTASADTVVITCSAAESISTDGGGLIRSEDSDWMSCYKNHFLGV
ncbi:PREDICTED: uncharacterized protein LOC104802348 [Tarenaya hassleriana]|uniref:uncharacterized protein LOC104802348 n=1 Tax=Tarenaya hassleriana TaxID=28532 RepID=UPI00053C5EDE|nr:PREDICTED: uncharacterized protein LOC104802348 [Tarenaya hassleriana]